jgi:hypothetical protein
VAEAVAKKPKLDNDGTGLAESLERRLAFPKLGAPLIYRRSRQVGANGPWAKSGTCAQLTNEIEKERHDKRGPILFLGGLLIGLHTVYMLITLLSQSA